MLWPSTKTHFTRLLQSLELIVPHFIPGLSTTAPDSVLARRLCATRPRRRLIPSESASETKENAKLREERDILRKAAKYFAEETRW